MPEYLPIRVPSFDNLAKLLEEHFPLFIEARRFADATVDTYRQALKRLTDWTRKTKKRSWPDTGIAFRNYMLDQDYSPRTINLTLGAMRSYFGFLAARGFIPPENPFVGPKAKVQRGRMDFLEVEECERILQEIKKRKRPVDLRDRAIFRLVLTTGLRVSGVAAADIGDLGKIRSSRILRVRHKGRLTKDNYEKIGKRTDEAIKTYLKCLKGKFGIEDGALFRSHPGPSGDRLGKRMSRQRIYEAIRKRAKAAGIQKRITPHSLRRTAATLVLAEGSELRDVQQMLGHASVKTTELYNQALKRLEDAPEDTLDELLEG